MFIFSIPLCWQTEEDQECTRPDKRLTRMENTWWEIQREGERSEEEMRHWIESRVRRHKKKQTKMTLKVCRDCSWVDQLQSWVFPAFLSREKTTRAYIDDWWRTVALNGKTPLIINFNDFNKAFVNINGEALLENIETLGSRTNSSTFLTLYLHSSCCVKTSAGNTEMFNIHMCEAGLHSLPFSLPHHHRLTILQWLHPINYHQLEHKVKSVHRRCGSHTIFRVWDVEENVHEWSHGTPAICLPSPLPTYNPRQPHLMARPCHKWGSDKKGRHEATPSHCRYKERSNGWPHPPSAESERKTYTCGRRNGGGGAKKTWRRTFKPWFQLAWSPQGRQWPWEMETSRGTGGPN